MDDKKQPALKITNTTEPPNGALDRLTVAEVLLACVDWTQAEERPYGFTTRAHNIAVLDTNTGESYQIGISINKRTAARADGKFKLTPREQKALERIAAKASKSGNADMAKYADALRTQQTVSADDIAALERLNSLAE